MRYLLSFLFVASFLLTSAPAQAQQTTPTPGPDAVTKTACTSTFAYPNLEALKEDVLARAKRLAVEELYGEFISALTQVENFAVTSDQVRSLTSGFVRLRGDARYYNSTNLAEVCVAVEAYTTAEDRAKFQSETVSARNCEADATRSVRELRLFAEEEVRVRALVEYDARLEALDREIVLRLLRRVSYTESTLLTGTDSYCATVSGEVTPVEVLALLEGSGSDVAIAPPSATTPTRTPTRRPIAQATPTPNRTLSSPQMTATAAMQTVVAFQARTATPTPTHTPTPNRTATTVAQFLAATATAVSATAQAIAAEEAATATAIAGIAQAIATAQAQGIDLADIRLGPVDGAVYVYVPAGPFVRGSESGSSNEQPMKTIEVSAFWIGQTEVTNAQYGRCVAAGKCAAPNNSAWDDADKANHPVTDVDWNQATAYAEWAGGRLPTEAEWEKACRGDDGRTYAWGEAAPDSNRANFSNSNGSKAVGSYPSGVSPYGLLDMSGNVLEWTSDWYGEGYYAQSPGSDPTGPSSGQYRVLRGGAFYDNATYVRCADRGGNVPGVRDDGVGFRVVLPPGF